MHLFFKFIFGIELYMFRTVPLSVIRIYSLYTQQWCMSYRFVDRFRAGSGWNWAYSKTVYKPVWHIPLLSVQWINPDDGQRNCPKHAAFHFQNKFEKLVHLVGFIIRKFVTTHGRERKKKIVGVLAAVPCRHCCRLHSVAMYPSRTNSDGSASLLAKSAAVNKTEWLRSGWGHNWRFILIQSPVSLVPEDCSFVT
jgi:hypothetical protein